jgi:hypothetical protein
MTKISSEESGGKPGHAAELRENPSQRHQLERLTRSPGIAARDVIAQLRTRR